MNQKEYAIIVAGGKGTRIKSKVPKQFIELAGYPVLMHTINTFHAYSSGITIILVLPEDDLGTWQALCKKHDFNIPVIVQSGGDTRFQSVKKGLDKIVTDGLVAIHDGVRPLVSADIIRTSFHLASIHQSAVAAVPLKDSIRMLNPDSAAGGPGNGTTAMDRSRFRLIQTPQTFSVQLIKQAYCLEEDPALTDDASVAERWGHQVVLFEGSYENIKITTEEDLVVAEAILKKKAGTMPG